FDKLNRNRLEAFKRLRLIVTRSVGYDHIDINYCRLKGIKVAHMPAYSPRSVAEHAIAMMFALIRRLKKVEKRIRNMDFSQDNELEAQTFADLTVGVIGTGKIGSWTAKILHFLGSRVLAYDVVENIELKALGVNYTDLEKLLKESDIISLHVPYTPQTHHMINAERIKLMKEGAILINTSRGKVVDTDALYEALMQGKLGGAGLDVFEDEELLILKSYERGLASDKNLKIIKLSTLDNVIITPHIAYYTKEAVNNIRKCTVECIEMFLKQGSLGRFEVV
ncbi:MAG: NAD(P)-dependent oxidoreductase, partial [Hydrogenobacter sp.]